MAGIPEHIIDQVRDRTDIAEVISRYVTLKKAGRNYKALCPFHHEKTPSFMISPAKQIYHCFGCGAGGNVFNFLMKYERLEFPEAVRELADRAGVVIPARSSSLDNDSSLSEKLHGINERAAQFYRENLLKGTDLVAAKRYLEKRNISQQIAESFKLGYAPKLWNGLTAYLKNMGYADTLLEKSGLVIKGKNGKFFDRFRDRIIFPIADTKGKIKGFGSRVLDESQPKYMNSPDTYIYSKGNHLYGLNLSWEAIRDSDRVVVVEGNMDLLTSFQNGIRNIVAPLGTALTVEQIRLLKRYTNNIIMLFDADLAGQNATLRSLDLLVEEDVTVRVTQLPKGHDPDNFINKYGAAHFKKLLDNAEDLFDYKLNVLLAKYDHRALEGKARLVNEMLPLISKVKNTILKSGYLKRLAERLSISESDLRSELKKVKPDYTYRYKPISRPVKSSSTDMAEKILAGLMLEDNLFIKSVKDNLNCEDFQDRSIKKIVEKLFQCYDNNEKIGPSKLIDTFKEEEDLCACISSLTATCENLVDKKRSLEDCIQWVKQYGLKERLRNLCNEIKIAQDCGDDSRITNLIMQYNDIMKEAKT